MKGTQAHFKSKLQIGSCLGIFSKTTDSSMVEVMAHSGLDFVILDMEHGPITTETLKHHLMALKGTDTLGIVRVEGADSPHIGKALDLGAHGIQVSSVSGAAQAAQAVAAAKFHPEGMRGVCRFVRAADYAFKERNAYFSAANEGLLILQIEGKAGLEAFDDIVQVPGIDVLFVGPYDLSQSLGVPGQVEHPKVMDAIREMQVKAARRQVVLGTFCDTPEQLQQRKAAGFKYLAYSVDLWLFGERLIQLKNQFDAD
jgi:4-hydroxy-2-oxoheptanedioate aldolase